MWVGLQGKVRHVEEIDSNLPVPARPHPLIHSFPLHPFFCVVRRRPRHLGA